MKHTTYLVASLLSLIALTACTKHKGDTAAGAIPVATLVFSSPTAGGSYTLGDSVLISGSAISTGLMHGYDIAVHKAGDTATKYFFVHIHDHNDTLLISQKWKNTVPNGANLEAEVTLYLDHDGHTKSGKVGFRSL